ncbi:anaerobic nitric oxide reductase flavorubredoxin [Irregularibacter muris]|jgi:flavorubredoxin|uniref:Anaerobic nitric oxide reductase flavorubredoxin n=1 Tax=Irregularibacter muris TaxID=1796619 RepID=A0AAE3HJC2_9FIRM|nr:anaerobic nitric oxide reductase flavorubredoxin [Irregularibacter muris]MCR1899768.1 anaerobic nitric oxide reductase flavorubredoxin [Irregularibacter muris]
MGFFKVTENVTWVGKTDWELKKFHGEEYSTHRGSTYNSYLVRDEKTVLIDTVWQPYAKEYVENLKKEIDLNEIDYIIANHAEIDHSGALPELMREIPNTPIYCTQNGIKSLKGHYHQDWNFVPVKTGDTLNIGKKDLIFIEARMLHWPDSMFCYLTGDNILFSNDAFGQHYCSEFFYNDLVDQAELYQEAIKYYANILTPFSKLVENKINEVVALDVPVDFICTSHGVIWREDPLQIVNQYMEWAKDYQENQVTLIYDTMWNGTRRMAETIAQGIKEVNPEVEIVLHNCGRKDKNDIITDVFKSKAVLVGSSTINGGILSSVAAILEQMRGLRFKKKKAAAFGSYGWSGESIKMITEELQKGGFEIINDGHKTLWFPDAASLEECIAYGKEIGNSIK